VPLARVRWSDYDVVKTLFHIGFETLERFGGTGHPFIVSKLGSVVAPEDRPGIYFYGERRARLAAVQERLSRTSHYVALLSEPARELWRELYGGGDRLLLVPGAADRELPPAGPDPYPAGSGARCLFAGNIYTPGDQREANRVLVDKLNRLGAHLAARGLRLYFLGTGDVSALDPGAVTRLGTVTYEESWRYVRHAAVGIVVAPGPFLHNNESTKIYHYLRAGLPVVSEAGFPNDRVVTESGLGFVAGNGDLAAMAERCVEAASARWDRAAAVDYILRFHTWDVRAAVYDRLIAGRLAPPGVPA
jgi:glycosyltransferase involved in cell wall biosynthesis